MFLWNSRPDLDPLVIELRIHAVSILVFVELAPGQYKATEAAVTIEVSILVFVELAPGPLDLVGLGQVT